MTIWQEESRAQTRKEYLNKMENRFFGTKDKSASNYELDHCKLLALMFQIQFSFPNYTFIAKDSLCKEYTKW